MILVVRAGAFADVDLNGEFMFGVTNLGALCISAGFVLAGGDDILTIIYGNNGTVAGNGASLFFDIDY